MRILIATLAVLSLLRLSPGQTSLAASGPEAAPGCVPVRLHSLDWWGNYYLTNGHTVVYTVRASNCEASMEGPFSIADSNGVRVVSGNYKDGKWQGEVLFWHTNGMVECRRFYDRGLDHGAETCLDDKGFRTRTLGFSNGEKHGLETYWKTNGTRELEIEWEHGDPRKIEFFEQGKLKKTLVGPAVKEFFREKVREYMKANGR